MTPPPRRKPPTPTLKSFWISFDFYFFSPATLAMRIRITVRRDPTQNLGCIDGKEFDAAVFLKSLLTLPQVLPGPNRADSPVGLFLS